VMAAEPFPSLYSYVIKKKLNTLAYIQGPL
jgi:hypothetical protein